MSTNYSAYTIIGSLINEDDLYNVQHLDIHRDCEASRSRRYCPDCGKKVGATEEVRTPVEGYDPYAGEDEHGSINGVYIKQIHWGLGITAFFVPSLVCKIDKSDLYDYGRGPKQEINATRLEDFNLDEHKEKIKSVLEPAGLWDPTKFGIWTALYGGW